MPAGGCGRRDLAQCLRPPERAARTRGIGCQQAVLRSVGSDASIGLEAGLVPSAACIAFPTENFHGYEVAPLGALESSVAVLREFLDRE